MYVSSTLFYTPTFIWFSQSDYHRCIIWLMKYSLTVNCRKIGICHKSSKRKIHLNRYDRSRISSRYVLTFHVPDWLARYHHCWRSVLPRRSISPALCPSRPSSSCSSSSYLRALRGHAARSFVVRRAEVYTMDKKGEGKGRKWRWKEGLGDWPADWRLDRNCNDVESWSRRQSMSLSSSSTASHRSLIPRGNPCVTKAKKVGDLYVRNLGPEKGRDVNHLLGLHTSRSLSSPIDHADCTRTLRSSTWFHQSIVLRWFRTK